MCGKRQEAEELQCGRLLAMSGATDEYAIVQKLRIKMRSGFPAGLVVVSPLNDVLQLASAGAGVLYFFDVPILSIVDNEGKRRMLMVSGNGIGGHRFQEPDMEHAVDFNVGGDVHLLGMRADKFVNRELPKLLVIEVGEGLSGVNVVAKKPDLAP